MKTLTFLEAIAELESRNDACLYAERIGMTLCIFWKPKNSEIEFTLESKPGVFTPSYAMSQDILRGEYVIKRIEVADIREEK